MTERDKRRGKGSGRVTRALREMLLYARVSEADHGVILAECVASVWRRVICTGLATCSDTIGLSAHSWDQVAPTALYPSAPVDDIQGRTCKKID